MIKYTYSYTPLKHVYKNIEVAAALDIISKNGVYADISSAKTNYEKIEIICKAAAAANTPFIVFPIKLRIKNVANGVYVTK